MVVKLFLLKFVYFMDRWSIIDFVLEQHWITVVKLFLLKFVYSKDRWNIIEFVLVWLGVPQLALDLVLE